MARPFKIRKLIIPHKEFSYRPSDNFDRSKEIIHLFSDEFEAIKLIDYENMNHLQASRVMGISRPTITRIYKSARNKIAECLIESKELNVGGGNYILDECWFRCGNCKSLFNIPSVAFKSECPVCNSFSSEKL